LLESARGGNLLRVVILSSEAVPYAKTGGLGDVAGALPKALYEGKETDVALIIPLYQKTRREYLRERVFERLDVNWELRADVQASVWYSTASGAPTFLIDAPAYFERESIYGYRDDYERFAFFSRAALALTHRLGAAPDVIHGNDWQSGFAILDVHFRRRWDAYYQNTRTLLSIHNMAYQGLFDANELWRFGYAYGDAHNCFLHNGAASSLKAGLMTADAISTVSPRYAQEIQTPEQGYGLDWLLRQRSNRLVGITNGIDDEVWNPETDPHIAAHFSADDLTGKRECKRDLLRHFNLPEDLERPIIANISRLVAQKGYDLIKACAGKILETGAYFIALGAGAEEYEDFLQALRDAAPQQVGIYKGYASESLAHKVEAGADIFLMPSLYEPCGLNQMYSMRYGTVPVVRATGGLDDTVQQFDRIQRMGNGFKFYDYAPHALLGSLYEALYCYNEPEIWRRIQTNGMRADNSWRRAAHKYVELYREIMRLA
jgi:starch synthase